MLNQEKIRKLEDRNAELAKEILLNETAIYETKKELDNLDKELFEHPKIQQYVNNLKRLVDRINRKNNVYKKEIYENELEIIKLKKEENEDE